MPPTVRLVVALLLLALGAPGAASAVVPKQPPLTTPWTAGVSRTAPLPEYPRPQMVRREWRSLNGEWQFAGTEPGATPTPGVALPERILVPFPVQSALSGIQRTETAMTYRRSLRVPAGWRGQRILLHFGAVANRMTAWVNGVRVGRHVGSYDAFSFDITKALRRGGPSELLVQVEAPSAIDSGQPVGKQFPFSVSILFTASSGIWQSVWMEPVAPAHLERVTSIPDVARERLLVTPRVRGGGGLRGLRVVATARDGRRVVGRASGPAGARLAVSVPRPRLWTPERPHLYDLDVALYRGTRRVDVVDSYFGMRTVGLKRVGGAVRTTLNGKPIFQIGTLDQGFWPDGIHTAPSDAALRFDIAAQKRLGFNMVRKHVKVEPARWYHWADRLGILVWQDMPNMPINRRVTRQAGREFERQLRRMVDGLESHPSITTWVPFNEGWGQFDVSRVVRSVERQDPSRLVDGHSGAANCCLGTEPAGGDLRDTHLYNGPGVVPPDHRASVIGELGGIGVRSPGHEWPAGPATPSFPPETKTGSEGIMRRQWAAMEQQARSPGISGAVYVELYDVEREFGGILTYDRRVTKVDAGLVRRINRRLIREGSRARAPQPGRVPAGASGAWSFDEPSGEVAQDGAGARPLRLTGGAARVAGRRGGRAIAFDGPGARAATTGPVVDTAGSFTVSAWLRLDTAPQTAPAVVQEGAGAPGFALAADAANERTDLDSTYGVNGFTKPLVPPTRWAFQVPGHSADTGYGDPAPTRVGAWRHVTGVVDRATRTVQLSLDGVAADTRIAEATWTAVGPLVLGGSGFRGAVDDLRVYPRALTPAEVWELHAAQR